MPKQRTFKLTRKLDVRLAEETIQQLAYVAQHCTDGNKSQVVRELVERTYEDILKR